MIAYKFLRPGAVAPFGRFTWPTGEPGPWVEAQPSVCVTGVHACRREHLPYWLAEELWEIELDGVLEAERKLVAHRGRLVRRVEAWDDAAAEAFGAACAARVEALDIDPGYAADAARFAASGRAPNAAFVAARAAELAGGPSGYDRERRLQAEWLAERLALRA